MSGTNDMCTPLIAKLMYDAIPHTQWELFDGARHMCGQHTHMLLGSLPGSWPPYLKMSM